MIWILDNGGEFSDHVIEFVEGPADFRMADFIKAQRARLKYKPRGYWHVIATAENFTWYEGEARQSIDIFAHSIVPLSAAGDPPPVDWRDFLGEAKS